jgi:hypothetical protein
MRRTATPVREDHAVALVGNARMRSASVDASVIDGVGAMHVRLACID